MVLGFCLEDIIIYRTNFHGDYNQQTKTGGLHHLARMIYVDVYIDESIYVKS